MLSDTSPSSLSASPASPSRILALMKSASSAVEADTVEAEAREDFLRRADEGMEKS